MDALKTQLNKYFIHLGENHTTSYKFVHLPLVDLGAEKDEDIRETIYYPRVICDNSNILFMFRLMVENNVLYLCVCSNYSCPDCH